MSEYVIRYATEKDIPLIKTFIDANWKKDHILVRKDGLFEWQYISDKLDYVIGIDKDGQIQGMLGFISYSNDMHRDIATSMWKANPGTGFLGIKLLMFVMDNEKHRALFSPGINIKTSGGIYKRMGITTGRMHQWYRLNDKSEYIVANIKNKSIPKYSIKQCTNIINYLSYEMFIKDFNHEKYVNKAVVPYKSLEYIRRRYFEHPVYDYLKFGVIEDGETKAVFIVRIQPCNKTKVLRFVDCIGDYSLLGNVTEFLDHLLDETDAEYIDMYEKGLSVEMLINAGWTNLAETQNIIPNYFSPYEQCNIDIYYCTTAEDIILFRGDGDQDRPN